MTRALPGIREAPKRSGGGRGGREDGFTLLEVLVGLALAGLVLLGAFRQFETLPLLSARSDASLRTMQELFEFHERLLALSEAFVDDARAEEATFEPGTLRARTVATAAGPLPRTSTFAVSRAAGRVRLDYPVHDRIERRDYRFAAVAFAYFGRSRPGEWVEVWPKSWGPPDAVRVRVRVAAEDVPYEFVLRLPGRRPGACLLMPDDTTCGR